MLNIITDILLLVLLVWLCGCSSESEPYLEYVICVNGECDWYTDVDELEVCINKWDSERYNLTTSCYNIIDIDKGKKENGK